MTNAHPATAYRVGYYRSTDGGLSWEHVTTDHSEFTPITCDRSESITLNGQTAYRFTNPQGIELTDDGGQTWYLAYELDMYHQEARQKYYRLRPTYGRMLIEQGVHHAVVDPGGNVVFEMGWDGILVNTVDGQWKWVTIDQRYYLENLNGFDRLPHILILELLLGIALWLL